MLMDSQLPKNQQSAVRNPTLDANSKIVRSNQLIIEKLLERAEPLYEQMGTLLLAKKSVSERFNEIALLRPIVEALCIDVMKHVHYSLVLSDNDQTLFTVVLNLNESLIKIYFAIIADANAALFPNVKIIQQTLQFAMHAYKKIFTHHYKHHLKIPEGKWQKLNKLYVSGKNAKCLNKNLQLVSTWHNQLKTIKEMYLYCILFSLINPYQYRHKEIELLTYAIEQWAGLLTFKKAMPEAEQQFYMNLNEDLPPSAHVGRTNDMARFINCDKLILRLKDILAAMQKASVAHLNTPLTEAESALPIYVTQRVLSDLTNRSDIVKDERSVSHYVDITVGLKNCFKLLSSLQQGNLDSEISTYKSLEVDFNDMAQVANEIDSSAHEQVIKHSCYMYSTHSNIIKFKLINPTSIPLLNDELVCFENPLLTTPTWLIGYVKQIINHNNGIYFDIECISLEAYPIVIEGKNNRTFIDIYALLAVERLETHVQHSIIVPGFALKVDSEILITHQNTVYSTTTNKLLYSNAEYQFFEIDNLLL